MHPFLFLLVFFASQPTELFAQPDRSIIIVRDERGRRMRGAYADTFAAQEWLGTTRRPAWTVELHFTVSAEYPYSAHEIGTHQSWPLTPDTVRIGGRRHLRFRVIDCRCKRKYLLVRRGTEMMRVELPNSRAGSAMPERASTEGTTPTVLVFRPGSHAP